jgi:phosphoserine aminotransferase
MITMTPTVLAPGPTKVHPEMGQWLQDAVAEGAVWQSHRSKWFFNLFDETRDRIRDLLKLPDTHHVIFMNSSNEAWERGMECLTAKESFHMVGGEFAMRWHQYTGWLGRNAVRWDYDHKFDGDFSAVEVPETAEAICVVNNETSIGLWIPEEQIHALGRKYPEKLLMVDCVSAMPHCQLDWSLVDVCMFSVQKGFHSTAGLSVVVVSERAMERSRQLEKTQSIGSFHAFSRVQVFAEKSMTAETPNVLAIYLLNKCAAKYQSIGLDVLRAGIEERAAAFYAALEKTSAKRMVTSDRYKSPTLFAVNVQENANELRARLEREHGIYTGACYGELKDHNIRVANFPMHTAEEHQKLLALL